MLAYIRHHRAVAILSAAALVLAIGDALWLFFAFRALGTGPFVLGFNDIQGITDLGGIGDAASMGVFVLALVGINTAVAMELDARDPWFGKMIAGITLGGVVLLSIAFAAIINAN